VLQQQLMVRDLLFFFFFFFFTRMRAEERGVVVRLPCQADCCLVIEDGYIAPRIYSLPIQKLTPEKPGAMPKAPLAGDGKKC
jgi:hypothetical protein